MKKSTLSNIILILMLIIGLSLLLYPSFSDYWNMMHQTRAIARYADEVANLKEEDYGNIWKEAIEYNQYVFEQSRAGYFPTDEELERYNKALKVSEESVMGYIEIPGIKVDLPIYHGTDENILQVAIGHLDWTSLPTGGADTHCALSGHRGLPSARLFTDLDQLRTGDIFKLYILDELLTYEVDQIKIVEPDDVDDLQIEEGEDLCTLVTCTPYGINTHRLLVRGHRIENLKEAKVLRVTSDAMRVEPILIAIILFVPILMMELILVAVYDHFNKPNRKR